ncbi:uncharacterized protein LOC62_04G005283 [Vanrija pseudolonga]|uniref:Uncharacterized protein n=1 Tax=Vanrija pseudolonga TaxID=143232 RepID=A0AAF1BIN4_9TREE|nr:hypothetical protein LOC62_04G005283 [Vanrija pseudolonga]
MPALLDSKTYPHLLSLITSFAPWPARLRLRATCRADRDAITRDLMEHVALNTAIEDKWPGRQAFYKEKAARPPGAAAADEDAGDAEKEGYDPSANLPPTTYDRDAWKDDYPEIEVHVLPFSLEHVRTIDHPAGAMMNGDAQNNCIGHTPNTFFPNKRTIRLLETLEPDFEAANLVAFITLPYEEDEDEAAEGVEYGDVQSKYSSSASFTGARVDLVLWRENATDAVPEPVLQQVYLLARDLVRNAWQDAVVTIVGADTLPPAAGGEETFKAAVKHLMDAYYHERIDAMRFMSREAWLDQLGEDRDAVGAWPVPLPARTADCAVCSAPNPWEIPQQ